MNPELFGAGAGLLGGALSPNMSGAYNSYGNGMSGLAGRYNPWINMGLHNDQMFSKESQGMVNDPMAEYNKIDSGFSTSPYQQHLLHQTQGMMNSNAAQTGMLGSMSANKNLGGALNNMTGQFENQYDNTGLSQYNNGMHNQAMLGSQGLGALGNYSNLMQEGYLGNLQGQQANSMHQSQMFGNMIGGGIAGHEGFL
tara:strand:- start:8578 stop:9168 length:591 start_codon:yes stop_codon:yes gene_type:complete